MRPPLMIASTAVALFACASDPASDLAPPSAHRPTADACGPSGGPRPVPSPEVNARPCASDAECPGPLGRCVDYGLFNPISRSIGSFCVRDECRDDADCGAGRLCACVGDVTDVVRACGAANCRLDADCGAGGYCSPSAGSGCSRRLEGWYCHTADDVCHSDADCPNAPGSGSGHCYFDGRRWACSPTHCG